MIKLYRILVSAMLGATLGLLFSGCASIDKSIHVLTDGDVTILYTTTSGTDIDAKDLFKGALK